MKTAIYLRVSTVDQADTGYGIADQRTKCISMAAVKGWPVGAEFVDDGISGTKDASGRPGLAALLLSVGQRDVDAVIVAALDRLGRSTSIVLDIVGQLKGAGCQIVSCKESIDTSTPTGQFFLTVIAALSQLDRDNIVARTTDGRNERGRFDGERGGRVPMGYVRIPGTLEVVEAEAEIVRSIYADRSAGATLTDISERLNAAAILSRRGGKWFASGVREILLNEDKYRGGNRGASLVRWPVILR